MLSLHSTFHISEHFCSAQRWRTHGGEPADGCLQTGSQVNAAFWLQKHADTCLPFLQGKDRNMAARMRVGVQVLLYLQRDPTNNNQANTQETSTAQTWATAGYSKALLPSCLGPSTTEHEDKKKVQLDDKNSWKPSTTSTSSRTKRGFL